MSCMSCFSAPVPVLFEESFNSRKPFRMNMSNWRIGLVFVVFCSYCILGSYQLQSSQIEVLFQLRKYLEYPYQLKVWNNDKQNICFISPSTKVNVTCVGDVVTELRITGDKLSKVINFDGYAIPNQTLSQSFSLDSLVATLSRLTNLRALSLVALGLWGPLPDKINRLSSLKFLDLSSNFLYGSIPPRIATMVSLKTLRLDNNFLNDSVPSWLDSLPNLSILSMMNNQLIGPFPASIAKIRTLKTLTLSSNTISGEVPDLDSLGSLKVLNLSHNMLDLKLPKLPNGLLMVSLNDNAFTGEVPQEYQKLKSIEHLDLSSNHLQGRLPIFLFSLPNIGYLNLASNALTGSLPSTLACGERLGFVDISDNRITGSIPKCLTRMGSHVYGNCLRVDVKNQHPVSYCQVHKNNSTVKSAIVLVGVIGGIVVVMVLIGLVSLLTCRRYCSSGCQEQRLLSKQIKESTITGVTSEILANARYISEAAKSGTHSIPACQMFSLEELKEATRNFHSSQLLGENSWGKIYKGKLRNGIFVAIRCLFLSNKSTIRNLKLRLVLLAKLCHPHLVCLLGHCIDNGGKADPGVNKIYLVYEYVANGNLSSHLADCGQSLKWSERLVILTDIAKAVQFLHTGVIPGFFNNQLKMSNILLDQHQRAKLSDYGLSVIYDDSELEVKGELSNPRSWQLKIVEDDTYSFGIILLHSIMGPSDSVKKNDYLIRQTVFLDSEEGQRRVVDSLVLSTASKESLSTAISIAAKCVASDSSTRPSFEDVLWNLQYAAQLQAAADGDQRL